MVPFLQSVGVVAVMALIGVLLLARMESRYTEERNLERPN